MKSKNAFLLGLGLGLIPLFITPRTDRAIPKDEPLTIFALSPLDKPLAGIENNAGLLKLISAIRIEKIRLQDDTLQDAIQFIQRKMNAPDDTGSIDISIRLPHSALLKRESLLLENVTAAEALRELGVKYQVSVYIRKQSILFTY
ncbi:MAG: hypothetical protein EOP85_13515 [Verrucomicrobiaceae bacterium]|nr:MAG: hypothetical protein EOP85_13515 [Verrucomicrobiaceae bacterium]